MDLKDILSPDCTRSAISESSKKKVLELISQLIAPKLAGVSKSDVFESLLQRERLGSTGIGLGIAIPHGRLENAGHPVAALITLKQPIDFDAIDNQPVDLIFALLVPKDNPEVHLKTLSAVAARLNDKECCRALRAATSDSDLHEHMISEPTSCN
ncbi:PTS IIA-like nitrogen regulatory protein PtsN [Aliidiomarina halalkaliphila]|uniref:PTS IIA-like nitrogen regulatory protein PtsN n=1 Tax=Aliidiomarina halalkaliphila TaxID=2593535 RepID=A0A552X617_9GAMM|nr:PTS IIA-like nitrogen regulatory protein PtsN [Aliidiomarina halalkaliphila]TRW50446.1 PTS IIA-like nitrogen regulatory protein PtsN [Aliidiomarina halalkaliphila]